MAFFLSLQNTYTTIDLALFQDDKLLGALAEDKTRASKELIPLIAYLLMRAQKTLKDLSFIAVNQGPGPFTTLRVVIASANGLSFASGVPLIGVDALDTFLQEYKETAALDQHTVVLLNAFGNDVYYGIENSDLSETKKGYKNIEVLLQELHKQFPAQSIRFLGNATQLHKELILQTFGEYAHIPLPLPQMPSVKQIGLTGFEKWKKQEGLCQQLFPLYLKQAVSFK